jgi:large subunit ribosomal protein L9
MKVVLLKDIKTLGRKSDIKNISDGYARNFLIPKGLAKPATESAVKVAERQKKILERQLEELKDIMRDIAIRTEKLPMKFELKVGERGEIFGSVTASDIKKEILKLFPELGNTTLKIKKDHIRDLGEQKIDIKISRAGLPAEKEGINGKVKIKVVSQQP